MHSRFLIALLSISGAVSVQGRAFDAHYSDVEKDVDTGTFNSLDDSFEFTGSKPSEQKQELYDTDAEPAKRRGSDRRSRAGSGTGMAPQSRYGEPEVRLATRQDEERCTGFRSDIMHDICMLLPYKISVRQDDERSCTGFRTDVMHDVCVFLPYQSSVVAVGACFGLFYFSSVVPFAMAAVVAHLGRSSRSRNTSEAKLER